MLHFCVLFQKLLPLIFFLISCTFIHYVKNTAKNNAANLSETEASRPHHKISENEKHIALITEEFFLSSVRGWEEGESCNRKLYRLLIFWMFALIMVLEVTVFLKAVKWHQNIAAAKVKLNLWVISKTQIILRQCKKQKTFPYHSMLPFFLKVRWNCSMKIFCLRGKKVGVFQ